MFSSTTSAMPKAAVSSARPSRSPTAVATACRDAVRVELHRAAGEIVAVELAEHQVGIGDGRPLAAAAVAGGAGLRARALRPDTDLPHRIDMGERAAAGADLHHVDHRDRDRHAGALLEAVAAGHLEHAAGLRRVPLDQADLRRGAAHVERQHPIEAEPGGEMRGKDRAAGRTGFDETHREFGCSLERDDAAAGMHQEDRAIRAFLGELRCQIGEISLHHRLDVGVRHHRVEALILAHLRRDLGRDRHRNLRAALQQHVADHPLVLGIEIGVDQAHGHTLVFRLGDLRRHGLDLACDRAGSSPVHRRRHARAACSGDCAAATAPAAPG